MEKGAYRILNTLFAISPVVSGVDKFTRRLTDWDQYVSPPIEQRMDRHLFMEVVGVIEVALGVGTALYPKKFGKLLALWLTASSANYLLARKFYDVAFRDFGLAMSALALGVLAPDEPNVQVRRPVERAYERVAVR